MVQLNRSMMERYEIQDHRPESLRAAIFGADRMMLGAAARLLDQAGVGALCITRAAKVLRSQDCMFTLLVRGDTETGGQFSREHVVQSILRAVDPEDEFEEMIACAAEKDLEMIFLPADCDGVKLALAARFLYARMEAGLAAPAVILIGEHPLKQDAAEVMNAMLALSAAWPAADAFNAWLKTAPFMRMLAEVLCGPLKDAEIAKARHDMNYRDDFIAWAEPQLVCTAEGDAPECIAQQLSGADFHKACNKKARVFDAAVFLCAAMGYLRGKDSFAQVMRDEALREWIGRAFFDEILPALPYAREEIFPAVISAFGRLENSMNDMPLMEIGRGMMHNLPESLLPAIRAHAEREFEAPEKLSMALAAAIMIYAGVRKNEAGEYEIQRGDKIQILHDDPEILEAFSSLSHDMPAESLAYAVLADRAIWGADLREIDGLEMRICFDIAAIQRNGIPPLN